MRSEEQMPAADTAGTFGERGSLLHRSLADATDTLNDWTEVAERFDRDGWSELVSLDCPMRDGNRIAGACDGCGYPYCASCLDATKFGTFCPSCLEAIA